MKVYLDASVLVALFMEEQSTPRAEGLLSSRLRAILVSDFASAEFASALARRVRMGELLREQANLAFTAFDAWAPLATERVEIAPEDVRTAEAFIRRLDLPLRTPDAIHIALAQRHGAILATLDGKMRLAAQRLGLGAEPV